MANLPFFGSSKGPPPFQSLGDVAAAEREVEAYFTRLASQPGIDPEGHTPFALNDQQAVEAYTQWLNGLSMAPGGLKKTADLGALKAVYVPFWVVSAMAYATYKGERGLNHHETEHYKDAQGNSQTRQVTKVRWSPANGEVTHYFEHMLICGRADLPADHVAHLTPNDVSGFQPFTAGQHKATVEPYTVPPKEAFNKGRANMETEMKKRCAASIGGDQQKVASVQTRYVGVSVRHVLLPCYQGTYKYKDKSYAILVHGATGKVIGARPYSGGKIALLVGGIVLGLVAVGLLVYFFLIAPHTH